MPAWIGALLAPIIERLLGKLFSLLVDGAFWVGRKLRRLFGRLANNSKISARVDKVETARAKALDGTPVTPEQEKELDEAIKDLTSNY